jgi:hypothetical protein
MRELIFGMYVSQDGYIAVPGDDLGRSEPGDELFRWWLDRASAMTEAVAPRDRVRFRRVPAVRGGAAPWPTQRSWWHARAHRRRSENCRYDATASMIWYGVTSGTTC